MMHNKHTHFLLKEFNTTDIKSYRKKSQHSKVRPKQLEKYMQDRVDKLRELYEKHSPNTTFEMVMPAGETDGRKAMRIEKVIGEDVSPFDLPDFDKQMPNIEDYHVEEEINVDKFGLPKRD